MPRGDKTGPNGIGPTTGRKLGYCVGNNQAGFENNTYERGNGFGRGNRGNNRGQGNGYGYKHGYNATNTNHLVGIKEETLIKNEINVLKDQLENLENRLKTISKD